MGTFLLYYFRAYCLSEGNLMTDATEKALNFVYCSKNTNHNFSIRKRLHF